MNRDISWLILFLIILFIMWHSNGGRFGSSGIIMSPQKDSSISESNVDTTSNDNNTPSPESETPNPDKFTIYSETADTTVTANNEYIRIRAAYQNKEPVDITGWTLVNKNGEKAMIGYGSNLPYSAQINKQEDILLAPDHEAVIITGKSPIGTSFRLNLCTGYFGEFQTFYPRLPKNCPATSKTPGLSELNDDTCIKNIERQPSCQSFTSQPYGTSDACGKFMNTHINYQGCVADYQNDKNFFSPKKWYVYLGRDNEFWQGTRGTIKLYDRVGNLVAETTY